MSGEILAEDNSPMFLTVGDYNSRIIRTHEIATQEAITAERGRIVGLLEAWLEDDNADFGDTLTQIKGDQ